MNDSGETLWRSMESSFNEMETSSVEVSFKSLTGNCDDLSETTQSVVTPRKNAMSVEVGLIDALRNLQLASVKKVRQSRNNLNSTIPKDEQQTFQSKTEHLDLPIDKCVPEKVDQPSVQSTVENNAEDRENRKALTEIMDELVEECLQVEQLNVKSSIVSEHKQVDDLISEAVEDSQKVMNGDQFSIRMESQGPVINDKVKLKDPKIAKAPPVDPKIVNNMKNAVKPLLKSLREVRKTTIGVSPMLQTKLRCRATNNLPRTQLSTVSQSKKKAGELRAPRSSSLTKKQPLRNVVATVVSTKEGIQVKEEKISNFGIPVNIMTKKKRTQAVPFSFASRERDSRQELKLPKKLPMRDSDSINQQRQFSIIKSTTEKKMPSVKSQPMSKSLWEESANKENRSMNLNKSKTVIGRPKLSTGEREKKIEDKRNLIVLEQQKKERVTAPKSKKIPELKTTATSVFKIPAPVISKKPLSVPRK
ncbi:uncharacterized protein [Fopius arisanus]|uniref:Uncharacterized protein n=1 Tax=Fopius arisanus TaxID=64838 RepID=A0A9R1T0E3_9HYME|nr:PREDICTED: uncharacterized protein LOC105264944 [Fopius arisanus]